ncbi:MAG: hypothetical protein KatS3mg126_1704 [Lysobacteraceae bacterium]|nr:MAG: hypothetical protein KatS3mg126_1704 [Xanthomonadaceae bacterium]
MNAMSEVLLVLLIACGAFFALVGSFGLLRLTELLRRLHGPTKASTLGVGCILLASMLHRYLASGEIGLREILITVFVFLTAPIGAHMLARTALASDPDLAPPRPDAPPAAGEDAQH